MGVSPRIVRLFAIPVDKKNTRTFFFISVIFIKTVQKDKVSLKVPPNLFFTPGVHKVPVSKCAVKIKIATVLKYQFMNWCRQEAVKTNIPLYSRLMRSLSMVKTGHMSFPLLLVMNRLFLQSVSVISV